MTPPADTYTVHPDQLERTQDLLRERGHHRREGYVVWVGEKGRAAIVREVWPVSARGDAAHAGVSFDDVLALGERVHASGWFILAQVHSHPGDAFHSAIDDRHPISHQVGFISIVVPNFAERGAGEGWAYHEHLGHGRWRRLSDQEVRRRFGRPCRKETWWRRLQTVFSARHY